MDTLFTYIEKYGKFSFLELPFNEVDNIIFCAFTYLKIHPYIKKDEVLSIKEVYLRVKNLLNTDNLFEQNGIILLEKLSKVKRFMYVTLTHYTYELDLEAEKQFVAMTFVLPDDYLYVAFKGTDEYLVGWKEDFNMSYMDIIPSQKMAKMYLEEILQSTKRKVYVGGHSKGGNLAIYAFLFCDDFLKDKVIRVYNNDGPGFREEVIQSKEYQIGREKIISFLPKASLVGRIFNQDVKSILIDSYGVFFLQHDLYTWKVENNHFLYVKTMNEEMKKLTNRLNELLEKMSDNDKRRIVDFLYFVFTSLGITNLEKDFFKLLPVEINKEVQEIMTIVFELKKTLM